MHCSMECILISLAIVLFDCALVLLVMLVWMTKGLR